jgi:dihydrolipoamide dehydrogenase
MLKQPVIQKSLLALMFMVFVFIIFIFDLHHYISLAALKSAKSTLLSYAQQYPITSASFYFVLYVLVASSSLPGSTILTLAGGAIFGLWPAVFIISFASSVGATLAMLISRFIFKDWVQQKFSAQLSSINEGIKKDGALYLLSLRLMPIFPFFIVNLLLGLTPIRIGVFYFISQIGMFPATVVYTNAGTQLANIQSLEEILSPQLFYAFTLIGLLPLVSKFLLHLYQHHRLMGKFNKPKKFDYNVCVIGAGSGGLVASYIAAAVKAKVLLVEKNKMGGDCLNTGCVPSKALIKSAHVMATIKRAGEFGLHDAPVKIDFSAVMARVRRIIQEIAPHDSVERYQALGVECLSGEAKILTPYQVKIGERTITTKNIIIATGAGPYIPTIPGLSDVSYHTSDTIWNHTQLPKRLLVLGGGPIGCELAQAFARLGSEVSIIQKNTRLMMREDADISHMVQNNFQREGIHLYTESHVLTLEKNNDHFIAHVQHKEQTVSIPFDVILIALGRAPHTRGFGAEELGIQIAPQGTIAHNPFMQTNYPNIFTCGDVAGPYQFTHTAAHQAWYASVNALFSPLKKFRVDYRVIPWCTFVSPEVARVGINEQEAKEQGIAYECTRFDLEELDRAIADSENHGIVKVITAKGSDKILGVTICGQHAGDMIAEYVLAMKYNLGLNKILGTIHIYPTMAEANKYVAGVWKRAHVPARLLAWLERFHAFRRG